MNALPGANRRIYFPNLDALRFLAFLGVFMAHAWALHTDGMITPSWMESFERWAQSGVLGVNFFFVLSGFLITHLLLAESKSSGAFSIRNYYLRRTFRIWPLYFLLLIISFLLIPPLMHAFGKFYAEQANPFYFIFFLSNFYILNFGFPYSPLLAVLWSIAVEEQFYIAWPWLLKLFRRNRLALFLALVIVNIVFRALHYDHPHQLYFNTLAIISDFAVGGLLAHLALSESRIFESWKKIPRAVIAAGYATVILLLAFYSRIFSGAPAITIERLALGLAFAFVLFDQAFSRNRLFNFGNIPGFTWLGKISYGLYCFHELALVFAKDVLDHFNLLNPAYGHFAGLPILALLMTVAMASASYYLVEKKFLNWKKRFEWNSK